MVRIAVLAGAVGGWGAFTRSGKRFADPDISETVGWVAGCAVGWTGAIGCGKVPVHLPTGWMVGGGLCRGW